MATDRSSNATIEAALTDPGFAIDPYSTYELLRSDAPVYWSDSLNAWIVSRYSDVVDVLRDWRSFSNTGRVTSVLSSFSHTDRARFSPLEEHFATGMVHADPPNHTRLRRIVSHAFTSRTVEQLRLRIEQLVADLIEAVAGSGEMNLIADLAHPLPATVIAELFGAPAEDTDLFKKWSSDLGSFQGAGRADPDVVAKATTAIVEMRDYFRDLAATKRVVPGDDLLSALVAVDAEQLTEDELLSFCVTMLTAGHETTTSLIGGGMLALLSQPGAVAELRCRPELLETAVEELLRFDSPLQRTWRRVATDTRFRGKSMGAGQLVLVFLGSANRDPEEFAAADTLVLDRRPNHHIGLGTGVHFCLGAPLARLEAQIAFGRILDQLPDLRLASSKTSWKISGVFRCVEELPLTFTPCH